MERLADEATLPFLPGKRDFPVREVPGFAGSTRTGCRTTAGFIIDADRNSMASARLGSDGSIKKRRIKALSRVDVLISQF
jgi:hypothetical protein